MQGKNSDFQITAFEVYSYHGVASAYAEFLNKVCRPPPTACSWIPHLPDPARTRCPCAHPWMRMNSSWPFFTQTSLAPRFIEHFPYTGPKIDFSFVARFLPEKIRMLVFLFFLTRYYGRVHTRALVPRPWGHHPRQRIARGALFAIRRAP